MGEGGLRDRHGERAAVARAAVLKVAHDPQADRVAQCVEDGGELELLDWRLDASVIGRLDASVIGHLGSDCTTVVEQVVLCSSNVEQGCLAWPQSPLPSTPSPPRR